MPQVLSVTLAIAAAALFFAVAAWQTQNWLEERERLAEIETLLARPPEDLARVLAEPAERQPYRRVRAEAYPARGEIYTPATQGGRDGVRYIVPLRLDASRKRIIASIGFKPGLPPHEVVGMFIYADERERLRGAATFSNFPANVYEGVLLPSEPLEPGGAVPDIARGVWPSVDVPAMAEEMKVPNAAGVYLFVEKYARGWLETAPYEPPMRGSPHLFALGSLVLAVLVPAFLLFFPNRREADPHAFL